MEECEASVLRVAISETSDVALCKSVSWEAEKELAPVRIAFAEEARRSKGKGELKM